LGVDASTPSGMMLGFGWMSAGWYAEIAQGVSPSLFIVYLSLAACPLFLHSICSVAAA
jgi:hypothetical protein